MTRIKIARDTATENNGKVRLGEAAPAFSTIRPGDKVVRDTASRNNGKVRLGEAAPVFGR
jgi:hypothetical protein